ncbi:MAG: sigma-54-dependent Fis family transcriptional regulator [Candidatus Latescibacterota bacterium]|nr:MAG: sigma-54-dependent Fis family transcriptional regulator [Candidatus Latescibacterota bacterium]RKY73039.1 MAG: sigma-54-dependent Fis family transcriptional regulator [Candidatus Latescibacterota bacterium]
MICQLDEEFNILLVGLDEESREAILDVSGDEHWESSVADDWKAAVDFLQHNSVDVVVADASIPEAELAEISERLKDGRHWGTLVFLCPKGGVSAVQMEVDALLEKPIDRHELAEVVGRAQVRKRISLESGIVGKSVQMKQVLEAIIQIAPTDITVLVTGETGTGKELIARAIHNHSRRKSRAFLAVDCGALAEGILESELFGHERGAFTGAVARHKGIFEAAEGGTIFLDEIGEMSPATQVRFLRVLEQRELRRVGGTETVQVDVRVIAATNRDLAAAVREGNFRQDLYYRLKVFEIYLPPLRERREDIPLLVDAFVRSYCDEHKISFPGISQDAMQLLMHYPWPGNIRELRNLVESMVALSPRRKVTAEDIPRYFKEYLQQGPSFSHLLPVRLKKSPDQSERELIYRSLLALREDVAEIKKFLLEGQRVAKPIPINPYEMSFVAEVGEAGEREVKEADQTDTGGLKSIAEMEKEMIQEALKQTGGNKKKAARMLGIGERTLYRKIEKYGLQ